MGVGWACAREAGGAWKMRDFAIFEQRTLAMWCVSH
jgi:hypothetical protein